MSKHVFGAPHRDYVKNKKTVDVIFNKFENKQRGDLAKWEAIFNIPYATMNGWWNQYRKIRNGDLITLAAMGSTIESSQKMKRKRYQSSFKWSISILVSSLQIKSSGES